MLGSRFFRKEGKEAGPRKFHGFGVGSAKSGTHSIAAMFERSYAARHEVEHSPMIASILSRAAGQMTDAQAEDFILDRDRRLQLDMDSSQLNSPFVDVMARIFPDAKFILTIRDCYSFLNSITDHTLSRPASQSWQKLREHRFGGHIHAAAEAPLFQRGLYTLDGYLSYWANHAKMALTHVPPDRLLTIRTNDIRASVPKIADFLGIDPATIDAEQAHSYPAVKRHGVIAEIDPKFVEEKVAEHCADLMARFYPEIKSAEDVMR